MSWNPAQPRKALSGTMAAIKSVTDRLSASSASLQGPEEGQDLKAYVGDSDEQSQIQRGGEFIAELCCRLSENVCTTTASTICSRLNMILSSKLSGFSGRGRGICLIVLQWDVLPSFHPTLLYHEADINVIFFLIATI